MPDDADDGSEVAYRNALRGRADHVVGANGARDGARRSRARRLSTAAAEEDHDPAVHVLFSEVDVREERGARKPRV